VRQRFGTHGEIRDGPLPEWSAFRDLAADYGADLRIRLHRPELSLPNILSKSGRFGIEGSRKAVHHRMQNADP